jgi:uncharacterized protein
MRFYEGTSAEFIEDTMENQIADKLRFAYEQHYGRRANSGEVMAWNNSLQFLKNIVVQAELKDNMIVIEYELPYSINRIDCIIFGADETDKEHAVVIELKQWENVQDSEIEGNIITFVGGANRMHAHPSIQVRGYHLQLQDFVYCFNEYPPMQLSSCVYCHNYTHMNPVLFLPKFEPVLKEHPLFAREDMQALGKYLKSRIGKGRGTEIFNRFAMSKIAPSKKLLEHTAKTIKGEPVFNLIDDQIVAYNTIVDRAKKCSKLKQKSVIIVRGGPGTGKSVIALNVLAELLSKDLTVFHATGSKAFTTTLRKIVGTRAANHFKYFNSFSASTTAENAIDVLICDEAHRIRKTSNSRYTPAHLRSEMPQVEELTRIAKIAVFFIDDDQLVRPDEIGSVALIRETAKKFNADVYDFELKTQFRCSGSDGYLNWVDNTLGIKQTANITLSKNEKMEFKIFDSPHALYTEIKMRNVEKPNSARLVAGFCWSWSDANYDGTLKEDIVIGDFKMTWEAKDESPKLASGIPKAALWAYDPNGVNQAGSIYTIQGFEFEYVGVIFGKDLMYDLQKKEWEGHPENSADNVVKRAKEQFTNLVKNTYRVLLTRGMKGCYVYFMDKDTEHYFKSQIDA